MALTVSEQFAEFALGLKFERVPAEVLDVIKLRFLDTVGNALAALRLESALTTMHAVRAWGGREEASIIGGRCRVPLPNALLANGLLAHWLDYDDTHPLTLQHPSVVIVPSALAGGEAFQRSGREVLVAAAAGYEVMLRLGTVARDRLLRKGFHTTSVTGVFAATTVLGRLAQLDRQGLVQALGIAGSLAAGLLECLQDGSSVKAAHPGFASHGAALAVALSRAGMTGPSEVFEGRFGLLSAMLDMKDQAAEVFRSELGRDWLVRGVTFKPYPCCHHIHSFLDCALELMAAENFRAEDVDDIECRVADLQVPVILEPIAEKRRPASGYAAKFSLPYCLAAALVNGTLAPRDFAVPSLSRDDILRLAAVVRYQVDPDAEVPGRFPGWVRIRLKDGRLVERRLLVERGSSENPLGREGVLKKFYDNVDGLFSASELEQLTSMILDFEQLGDAAQLTSILGRAGAAARVPPD